MNRFEKATYVLLIAVCCVSLFTLIEARISRGSGRASALLSDPGTREAL